MEPGQRGKCPHCLTVVQFIKTPMYRPGGAGDWGISSFRLKGEIMIRIAECPNCSQPIMSMMKDDQISLLYPRGGGRSPPPSGIPSHIAKDYEKAVIVLPYSPEASAALSRRCLQAILRDAGKTKKQDLSDQIDEVLSTLPSHLQKSLDAVRATGNFAAHPIKSKSSGEIVDVEPGEADWNLDTIEALFEHYYVQPSLLDQKRKALDKKLQDAGKPPLK